MKSYEDKRQLLCDLAELYLDTNDKNYINVNDGIIDSDSFDSISFLILMALTYPKDVTNFYAKDINIDLEIQINFVNKEYEKIVSSQDDLVKKGKIVLDDAKEYYNDKYGKINNEEINKISVDLEELGYRI